MYRGGWRKWIMAIALTGAVGWSAVLEGKVYGLEAPSVVELPGENNTTTSAPVEATGVFRIEVSRQSAAPVKVMIRGKKRSFEGYCRPTKECTVTPWSTLLSRYAELFAEGSNALEQAKESLKKILGTSDDPWESGNVEVQKRWAKLLAGSFDRPDSAASRFLADITDGRLDDPKNRKAVPNARPLTPEARTLHLSQKTLEIGRKKGAYLFNLAEESRVSLASGKIRVGRAPSEIVMLTDDGAGDVNVLYHAFDRGRLKGRLDAYTQVAYDLFTSNPTLLMLPPEIQGELIDTLLDDADYDKAATLYDKMLEGSSTDDVYYRQLLERLFLQTKKVLTEKQSHFAAEMLATRLLEASGQKAALSRSEKVNEKQTVIDLTEAAKEHTLFGLFDGMVLDATAVDNDPYDNTVSIDFYTDSSLWYAVAGINAYIKKGFINDLFDPNLINPLPSGLIGKGFTEKKTALPIAKFDRDLKNPGTAKQFVVYRNKTGALFDAPFILNTIAVIDVIADLGSRIKLAKKASLGLREIQMKASDFKKKLMENPWLRYTFFSLQALYEFADTVADMAGEDAVTVDKRYGQLKLLIKKLDSLFTPDPLERGELRNRLDRITKIKKYYIYYLSLMKTALYKITKRKPRGLPVKPMPVKKSYAVKSMTLYFLWYQLYRQIGDSLPKALEEAGVSSAEIAYRKAAAIRTRMMLDPSFKLKTLSTKEKRDYAVLNYLLKHYLKYRKKEFLEMALKPEQILEIGSSVKEYVMKMFNLAESFDTRTLPGVIYNILYQSLKDLKAKRKQILASLAVNIAEAVTPASWFRVLRGANQGGAMLMDLFGKPTAYAFGVKRLNREKIKMYEIVPPAFTPISYIDTQDYGIDKIIRYDSPEFYFSQKVSRFQMMIGAMDASSLLAYSGVKFSIENDALVQKENLAQAYFEKHEDEKVVFADWHVYRHKDYSELTVAKRTPQTAFKDNYFRFSEIGEKFDCINDWSCNDDTDEYHKGDGNRMMDEYLDHKGLDEVSYFGFSRLFEDAGHKGVVTHKTPGVYTDSSHLWIGHGNEKKAPVQYQSQVRVYVAYDYPDAGVTQETRQSNYTVAVYSGRAAGSCGEEGRTVEQRLEEIYLHLQILWPVGVHRYRLYLRDRDTGRYYGPVDIPRGQKFGGKEDVVVPLSRMPGLIAMLRKRNPSPQKELYGLKVLLVDDIVSSYFENIGKPEGIYALMDRYWGSKGTAHNPMIVFWAAKWVSKNSVRFDSDGDGIPDDWETDHGLDANNCADASWDNDDDGLKNLQEFLHGTEVDNNDSDGDGMDDGWEVRYRLDPTDASDADKDTDHDGYSNLEEYQAGTNPRNKKDHPDTPPVIHGLKKTGQTKSYDADGNEVTDGSVKDDGYYQTGIAPSYSRDDAKEIVTDHVTGLMWQDDADAANITKTWEDAKAYCDALTLGGYSDWRLPTIEELEGIVDYGRVVPGIDPMFQHTTASDYWSSTTNAEYRDNVWRVRFYDGQSDSYPKTDDFYVRCVRGGK